MLTAILVSDANEDNEIGEDEMHRLLMRVQCLTDRPIDPERLRATLSKATSTTSLYRVTSGEFQDLMDGECEEEFEMV